MNTEKLCGGGGGGALTSGSSKRPRDGFRAFGVCVRARSPEGLPL